jgi:ketosteroid isomerase-like protein
MFPGWAYAQLPASQQSAMAAVRAAAEAFTAAAAARDGMRMGDAFAEDAFVMYPQPAPTIGRDANREVWIAFFKRPNATHPITTDSMQVSSAGDMAYITGRFASSYEGAQGLVTGGGRYLAVWRPINGSWRIVALSANSQRPAPVVGPSER